MQVIRIVSNDGDEMSLDLVIVLVLLVAAVAMFAIGRPRMDVVAVLMIVALPLTGILTVPETLAGFADPNVDSGEASPRSSMTGARLGSA